MTVQALNDALAALDWSGAELARRLGVFQSTVSGWRTGKAPVPKYASEYLRMALLVKEAGEGFAAALRKQPPGKS